MTTTANYLERMLGTIELLDNGVAITPRTSLNVVGATFSDDGSTATMTVGGGGGGGTPAGANLDIQINNAGAFGAITPGAGVSTWITTPSSANLLAALTTKTGTGLAVFGTSPTVKTSLLLRNPADTFSYAFTPAAIAADRTLNLPLLLATDTVAVLDFAQALTNKTIVAASNTITDTSAALGDLLYFNGTRFVRFARGADGQVLKSNATTIVWGAASGGAPGGSDTQVQFNDSSAFGGDAGFLFNRTTDVATIVGAINIGAATYAAAGLIRVPNAAGTVMAQRHSDDASDREIITVGATSCTFGYSAGTTWSTVSLKAGTGGTLNMHGYNLSLYAANALGVSISAVAGAGLTVTDTQVQSGHPIVGLSTAYSVHGRMAVRSLAGLATYTVSAAEYSYQVLQFSGDPSGTLCTVTLPDPANQQASYFQDIDCRQVDSADTVTFKAGAGTRTASIIGESASVPGVPVCVFVSPGCVDLAPG